MRPAAVARAANNENVDFGELIGAGSLSVRNCSNATRCDSSGIDLRAFSLISKIAHHIQEDGAFPKSVGHVK